MRVLAHNMKQQRSRSSPKVSVQDLLLLSVFILILGKLMLAKEGIWKSIGCSENKYRI